MSHREESRVDPELRTHRPSPTTELPLFSQDSCMEVAGVANPQGPKCPVAQLPQEQHAGCEGAGGIRPSPRFDRAVARHSDPENSHKAAVSVTNLGRTKDAILACLRKLGPQTDEQIAEYFELWVKFPVSPSGLRTRRSWLVDHGFIRESGTGKTKAGRACGIWGIAERNAGEKA